MKIGNDSHIGKCKLARFKQISMEADDNGIERTIPIMKCDSIMNCEIDVSLDL